MKRFIVIVLDGYGIGAMDDVPALRPQDTGANTARHIFEAVPGLRLPVLEALGLGNALTASERDGNVNRPLPGNISLSENCCYGFHRLAHFGADTFWGHQELMGTKPLRGESAPIRVQLPEIKKALEAAGHSVRFYTGGRDEPNLSRPGAVSGILVVDEAVTIGDNLETDLGNNYNVTAALDSMPFEKVRAIGAIVRSLVRSSRVIVFGGEGVTLGDILSAYEHQGEYAGVSAPRSGVYRKGYQVVHLGYGVDPSVQVPARLAAAGLPTVLIGKVADIVENPSGKSIPGVDTEEMLRAGEAALDDLSEGYICINVQETDLSGHREDSQLYAEKLRLADRGISGIMKKMEEHDILVVTADHGNDPTIGHAQHTREKTPVLVYGSKITPGFIGPRESLADTGCTVCDYFGAPFPEFGASYLQHIVKIRPNQPV
ncbi:phosphopentomutase [Breznakiella homolactica]|uniref:Phosphopentomutase n=1 Tax=Breznakiella homolactica TaxID=2798577 RepID=A0A7T7XR75_9SPIR|nr:phosphopentomutase [Breznakiella homolactica]QQO10918.1 phosphopentomutase [Breznakiella homolactica]